MADNHATFIEPIFDNFGIRVGFPVVGSIFEIFGIIFSTSFEVIIAIANEAQQMNPASTAKSAHDN